MEGWVPLLLPFALILARTSAFVGVVPIFGAQTVPVQVRAGLAVVMAVFLAIIQPPPALTGGEGHWLSAALMLIEEVLCGLALGLAARLIFSAVQQGGLIIGREMGFTMAFIVDPSTGDESDPLGMFLETVFLLLFLAAGGHHLLLRLMAGSYRVLPAGQSPDLGLLASGVLAAGSAMLTFALKLAGPILAALLIMAVVLAVLSRVLPEMDILFTSLPLRVGLGLLLAIAMVPVLQGFSDELAAWMSRFL